MSTNNSWNSQNPAQVALGGTGRATLTNHGVLVGAATSAITQLAAGSSGQVLQSGGASADPAYSTATYPTTATSTGTILRADGTNWSATTSTYPNTNAVNTLLYASSANVMSALTTANSGVLATNSSGVPSIDTTNFSVLSTGVQLKGNNANTAPPSGFIGEEIKSVIASTGTSISNNSAKTIFTLSLTAGVWDVSLLMQFTGITTATAQRASISLTTNTEGTLGDNTVSAPFASSANQDIGLVVPAYRITLGTTTNVFGVALAAFSAGSGSCYGRMKAVRVG